ncbi:MAG: hypothetical protein F6K23_37815 [Okeania sp. SIO2C9]|uniref:hypothetical protein n=1 Tax=Okeania sp. SIO2C9 TaxID=2607791 RepID=UPI0013C2441F|nr:hypothetical protein [Okeania sp. SIO2C9]NEQ78246.1 hypothetical protein [Okeania sp. SIO2C9]
MNVQELLLRYDLSSRAALYTRLKVLGFELAKDDNDKAFATPEQLVHLDQLHEHIKAGNKMSTFVRPSQVNVVSAKTVQSSVHSTEQEKAKKGLLTEQPTVQGANAEVLLESLVGVIINNLNPPKNPLEKNRALKECEQENLLLTTKEIEEIVGRKPRKIQGESYCIIGGWKFIAKGKSGNKTLWGVEQLKLLIKRYFVL